MWLTSERRTSGGCLPHGGLGNHTLSVLLPFTLVPFPLRRLVTRGQEPGHQRLVEKKRTECERVTSIFSLRCVRCSTRPTDPAMRRHHLRNPHRLPSPLQQSSEQSHPGLGSTGSESSLRGISTTRGRPRGSCLTAGSLSTGHKSCVSSQLGMDPRRRKRVGKRTASKGFVTLLNSRQVNMPTGLSTRYTSRRTSGIEVTFRVPNTMVCRS